MAAELLTLEELIEKATDINNFASNEVQAIAVSDQVNKEIGGSHTAVKILIQKVQFHQEIVTLQTLNVIDQCVKNCGVKFHNEIGKYKFINELIKLLSPKYDGDITPPTVKDRVIGLLYSWYVGLPQEKKIGEAYRMLKQQGIIKRDPVDSSRTTESVPTRDPENTVFCDQGNSELLATLLASENPDDLQSANKLIKSMVKQEEMRLERVSNRIQELETVGNNVKLLDDMLAKYTSEAPQCELEIMNDLYESCLKMRPDLFRLASRSAEDKDDSMAEILCASDELTRVIDLYKEKVLLQKFDVSEQKPYHIPADKHNTSSNALLDLGFGPAEPPPAAPTSSHGVSTGNTLLDEQFKLLGLDAPIEEEVGQPQTANLAFNHFPQFSQQPQPQFPQQPQTLHMQNTWSSQLGEPPVQQLGFQPVQPPVFPTSTTGAPSNQSIIGGMRPSAAAAPLPMSAPNKSSGTAVPQRKDLLDFDVFSEFRSSDLMKPKSNDITSTVHEENISRSTVPTENTSNSTKDEKDGANQSVINHLLDIESNEVSLISAEPSLITPQLNPTVPLPQIPPAASIHSALPNSQPMSPSHINQPAPVPPDRTASPQGQETYLVPLEALKTGDYEPIIVHDKDGLKTFLNIATDTREGANPSVVVTILSTISTSTAAVKDFSIQVAVPKVMRVKLQPATSSELSPFNPILPPPSVTQVMLIANPTKENVRLRFKMMYNIGGVPHVETSNVDQLPVT